MASGEWRAMLHARAEAAGVRVPEALADRLLEYLDLLAMWNRRINLTAFDLSAPREDAVDRLLIEPVTAAALVRRSDRRMLDIGSGGGSPAVPLALAVSFEEVVLVEVRAKKAAFLREVIRSLSLPGRVEVMRVEDLEAAEAPFDLVTFRAVRADDGIWDAVDRLMGQLGRVVWFGGFGQTTNCNLYEVSHVGSVIALERRILS